MAHDTHQKANGAFDGAPVDCSLWFGWFFEGTGSLGGLGGHGRRRGWLLRLTIDVWEGFSGGKNLVVVPGVLVVLKRAVKRSQLPGDYKLSTNGLVPVPLAGVDALGDELAIVYGIVVAGSRRGAGGVTHRASRR
jgi:hypothetical protein